MSSQSHSFVDKDINNDKYLVVDFWERVLYHIPIIDGRGNPFGSLNSLACHVKFFYI